MPPMSSISFAFAATILRTFSPLYLDCGTNTLPVFPSPVLKYTCTPSTGSPGTVKSYVSGTCLVTVYVVDGIAFYAFLISADTASTVAFTAAPAVSLTALANPCGFATASAKNAITDSSTGKDSRVRISRPLVSASRPPLSPNVSHCCSSAVRRRDVSAATSCSVAALCSPVSSPTSMVSSDPVSLSTPSALITLDSARAITGRSSGLSTSRKSSTAVIRSLTSRRTAGTLLSSSSSIVLISVLRALSVLLYPSAASRSTVLSAAFTSVTE